MKDKNKNVMTAHKSKLTLTNDINASNFSQFGLHSGMTARIKFTYASPKCKIRWSEDPSEDLKCLIVNFWRCLHTWPFTTLRPLCFHIFQVWRHIVMPAFVCYVRNKLALQLMSRKCTALWPSAVVTEEPQTVMCAGSIRENFIVMWHLHSSLFYQHMKT